MRNLLPLLASGLLALPAMAAEFDDANTLHGKGDHAGATKAYTTLIEQGERSANLFYNRANAEYRQGRKGAAILDYERALALQPGHPEATANLAFLRAQTAARTEQINRWERLLAWPERATHSRAAWGAAAGFWIVAFSVAPLLWRRRVAWGPAVLGMALFTVCGASTVWEARRGALWIVTGNRAVARSAPAESSESVAALPLGSQLRLVLERGEWLLVKLPDGKQAWLPRAGAEPVALPDATRS